MKFLDQLQNPPREFTAIPFWFLNGDLTAEELRRQLRTLPPTAFTAWCCTAHGA